MLTLNFKSVSVELATVALCLVLGACAPMDFDSTSAPAETEESEGTPNGRPNLDLVPDGISEGGRPDLVTIDLIDYAEPEPPAVQPITPRPPSEEPVEPEPSPEPPPSDSDPYAVDDCGFNYPAPVSVRRDGLRAQSQAAAMSFDSPATQIDYLEPLPDSLWRLQLRNGGGVRYGSDALTMPGYSDDMPLFERGGHWAEPRRCYELPPGARLLTQAEAYDMYVKLVRETLWFEIDQTPGVRNIVGIRGAYPGTFDWHGNPPNRFNDTIVLLWRGDDNRPHVREFPVNTDTGAYNFGYHSSSSLRPNRYYPYENGWHRSYNALRIGLNSYPVRDDSNKNGHWDSDRNGWLSGGAEDHNRNGGGHNIHMGSVEGNLKDVPVNRWSAGCQVIPGTENWTEFIRNAWTYVGDTAHYFLIDARDIAQTTWNGCDARDGTHECPHQIRNFPYVHADSTATSHQTFYDTYNCSGANESGPERVYVVNVRESGTLSVSVDVADENRIDPDIHLLWGDDQNACLSRGHRNIETRVSPGRYLIIIDTWAGDDGVPLAGEYSLRVDFN